MKHPVSPEFERVLQALREIKADGQKLYLVGGAVRDLLLGQPVHDFDFVTAQGSRELAKALRKKLAGASFALDDERGFNRVILDGGTPNERHIDIAEFVGDDLQADLRARDFTINAMALDIDNLGVLIDPLGGEADLKQGVLREASPDAFMNDPLRVMRAVRMAQAFNLGISLKTLEHLRIAVKELRRVSGERIRDEFFKILDERDYEASLRQMWELGILREIFPCLPCYSLDGLCVSNQKVEKRLLRLKCLEQLYQNLESGQGLVCTSASEKQRLAHIARWQEQLNAYLDMQITPGRTVRNHLVLAALLLDLERENESESPIQLVANSFKLSNPESDFLSRIENALLSVTFSVSCDRHLIDMEVYRLLKELKIASPAYTLLGLVLADTELEHASKALNICQENSLNLLSVWFQRGGDILKPNLLMDGNEIMHYAGLAPGPIIGDLLEKLEEAQFLGLIKTIDQAKAFIDQELVQNNKR